MRGLVSEDCYGKYCVHVCAYDAYVSNHRIELYTPSVYKLFLFHLWCLVRPKLTHLPSWLAGLMSNTSVPTVLFAAWSRYRSPSPPPEAPRRAPGPCGHRSADRRGAPYCLQVPHAWEHWPSVGLVGVGRGGREAPRAGRSQHLPNGCFSERSGRA